MTELERNLLELIDNYLEQAYTAEYSYDKNSNILIARNLMQLLIVREKKDGCEVD